MRVGAVRLAGEGSRRSEQRALCRAVRVEPLTWIKNPDTGRRERFIRPEGEWQSVARPELRILDDEPWQAVRERMASPRRAGGRKGRGGVPTTLLGGVLRCGQCGGRW